MRSPNSASSTETGACWAMTLLILRPEIGDVPKLPCNAFTSQSAYWLVIGFNKPRCFSTARTCAGLPREPANMTASVPGIIRWMEKKMMAESAK